MGNDTVSSSEWLLLVTESLEETKGWNTNRGLADPANMTANEISKAPWEMSQLSIISGNHYALDLKAKSKRLQDIKLHLKKKNQRLFELFIH